MYNEKELSVASLFFRNGDVSKTPNWKRLQAATDEELKAIVNIVHQFIAEQYLPENENSPSMGRG